MIFYTRVFYFVAMTKGVYAAHAFTSCQHRSENQALAADCVRQLPRMLGRMLGGDAPMPCTLFSDRGPGFYHRRYGTATGDYDAMRSRHGFELWAGTNALAGPHRQPPDLADVLLHETANAWLTHRLDRSALQLTEPWKEAPCDFEKRLQACVRDLNRTCDVRGLCMGFSERLRELVRRGGDRLKH